MTLHTATYYGLQVFTSHSNSPERSYESVFSLTPFQMFPVLSSTSYAKDWSAVSLKSGLGTGPIYRELAAQLETFQDELSAIAETGQPSAKHKGSIASDLGSADNSSVRHHLTVSEGSPASTEEFHDLICTDFD